MIKYHTDVIYSPYVSEIIGTLLYITLRPLLNRSLNNFGSTINNGFNMRFRNDQYTAIYNITSIIK
jgi:hypothetical protein